MDELTKEALKAWKQYGDAISEAWNFKKGSFIQIDHILEAAKQNDEDRLKDLIDYARQQTQVIQNLD